MNEYKHDFKPGVIVPAIGTASSTAALRSLSTHNLRTIAISEHPSPPGFTSKYCDETVRVPDPTRELGAYEQALLDLARRPDVQTILPFREADIYVLARNKEALADHVQTAWPALDTLQSVQDRVHLFDAARTADVAIPTTRPLTEWGDWEQEVIIKPRYTLHAREYSARFVASHTQSNSTQYVAPDDDPSRTALVDELGHVPLVQEYVPTTDEYGFFALYDHGEPVATFQHRQRRGWKYCGGPSAYRESVAIPELEAAGRDLLDELDWHGVAMVEFLRDPETDEFKLMEVNPRFWSSLPFTVQAGVNFPYLYWLQASGQPVETNPDYDVGVASHLLWGELLHLHSILREDYPLVDRPSFLRRLGEVAVSIARSPRFDYLDRSDLRPFIRDLRNKIGLVAGSAEQAPPDAGHDDRGRQHDHEPHPGSSEAEANRTPEEQVVGDDGRTARSDVRR